MLLNSNQRMRIRRFTCILIITAVFLLAGIIWNRIGSPSFQFFHNTTICGRFCCWTVDRRPWMHALSSPCIRGATAFVHLISPATLSDISLRQRQPARRRPSDPFPKPIENLHGDAVNSLSVLKSHFAWSLGSETRGISTL